MFYEIFAHPTVESFSAWIREAVARSDELFVPLFTLRGAFC